MRSGSFRARELQNQMRSQELAKLHNAVKDGRIAEINQFLSEGKIDPFSSDFASGEEKSLLALAAECGHAEVVFALLSDGRLQLQPGGRDYHAVHELLARLITEISDKTSPLPEVLQSFLSHPRIEPKWEDKKGVSILQTAIKTGNIPCVEALLAAGIDPNWRDKNGDPLLTYAIKEHKDTRRRLFLLLEKLIEKGADINAEGTRTPPLFAVAEHCLSGFIPALLSIFGADVNRIDNDGRTALHAATASGYTESVRNLLKAGLDVNKADNNGRTPLLSAAHKGNGITIQCLLDAGANLNWTDREDSTALHIAAKSGNIDAIVSLLKAEIVLNARDNSGRTPLCVAASRDNPLAVKKLLDAGADLHQKDKNGNTALHAAACNSPDILRLLLERGASPDQNNDFGETPLICALSSRNYQAFLLLSDKTTIQLDQADRLVQQMEAKSLQYASHGQIDDAQEAQASQQLAKLIYEGEEKELGRVFQGTTAENVESRRKQGMDPKKKTTSSVDAAIEEGRLKNCPPEGIKHFRTVALSHFYFTTKKNPEGLNLGATSYAKLAAREGVGQPKLLRAFLPQGTIPLELDPDAGEGYYRTSAVTPGGYVLGSKRSSPSVTAASEAFRERFNYHSRRIGLGVTRQLDEQEAAVMLRDQQSDSEADFSETEN